jgi:8-oxo-dGTP diphosphatase
MQSNRGARVERSAGGAVLTLREDVPHLIMIATRGSTRWGLPKGAANPGETAAQAAVREVEEETGVRAEVIRPLETIEYFFRAGGSLIHKYVDFFLMLYREGELVPQLTEVDDVAWFPLDEALERSSFPSERKMIEALIAEWEALTPEQRRAFAPAE